MLQYAAARCGVLQNAAAWCGYGYRSSPVCRTILASVIGLLLSLATSHGSLLALAIGLFWHP